MRFLADENVPRATIERLRDAAHDVEAVSEVSPGVNDQAVLAHATRENRILLTFDRDYGDLVYRHRLPAPSGVVYFRSTPASPEQPADQLLALLANSGSLLEGTFTVVEADQTRQRPMP